MAEKEPKQKATEEIDWALSEPIGAVSDNIGATFKEIGQFIGGFITDKVDTGVKKILPDDPKEFGATSSADENSNASQNDDGGSNDTKEA